MSHGGEFKTLVGYGRGSCGRQHDDNCVKRRYLCSNGHSKIISIRRNCVCGWQGKEECFCHSGKKVDKWPDEN